MAPELIWHHAKNGISSSKVVYFNLKESQLATFSAFYPSSSRQIPGLVWKKLWSLQISQKVRIFLWKAFHNMIACKANLFIRKSYDCHLCPICFKVKKNCEVYFIPLRSCQRCLIRILVGFLPLMKIVLLLSGIGGFISPFLFICLVLLTCNWQACFSSTYEKLEIRQFFSSETPDPVQTIKKARKIVEELNQTTLCNIILSSSCLSHRFFAIKLWQAPRQGVLKYIQMLLEIMSSLLVVELW